MLAAGGGEMGSKPEGEDFEEVDNDELMEQAVKE
jgi:hypothetical protein